jgi:branched-subunit amino acid aminotransferase/4-amino-4-deoxychorismate lyase
MVGVSHTVPLYAWRMRRVLVATACLGGLWVAARLLARAERAMYHELPRAVSEPMVRPERLPGTGGAVAGAATANSAVAAASASSRERGEIAGADRELTWGEGASGDGDGRLSPPRRTLAGLSRASLFEIAKDRGIPAVGRVVMTRDELMDAIERVEVAQGKPP